jgi:hypothetical protein
LIAAEAEPIRPALFVAEHVKFTPDVSAVRVVAAQPVDETIPDPVTLHVTVTLLLYHPLLPKVPEICGTMTGGVEGAPPTPM